MDKRAFFVIGPESSGTRMMTQAFLALGAYGDGGHAQRLDKERFKNGHEFIVFRRSVPHGKKMPRIANVIKEMENEGYQVFPVIIFRDKDMCAKSQIKNKHAENNANARTSIKKAVDFIYLELAKAGYAGFVIHYEAFVKFRKVRSNFFSQFNLPHPKMEFYNANINYKKR